MKTAPLALVAALVLGTLRAEAQWPQPAPGPPPAPTPGYAPPGAAPPAQAPATVSGFPIPVAAPPTPEVIRTQELLDQAKKLDSGRRLEWVWIDVRGGFEQLGMQTFNGGNRGFVAGFVNTSASGGVVSAGAGARLLYATLLVRGQIGVFDNGQLYRIGPEAGFHVPLGRVEPRLALGVGYAAMGHLHDTVGGAASALALSGFYTRVGAGLDYYVAPAFSVGVDVSGELLGLFRPALTAAEVQEIKADSRVSAGLKSNADLLSQSGAGWGGTLAVTAVLGLHF